MSRLRVVLDTNCLVSALLFGKGRLAGLRTAWQGERFVPVFCKQTASELVRVLTYAKFRLKPDEVNSLLAEILPYVETFVLNEPLGAIEDLTDASDAVFIHLVRQAKANWLVSGDGHLLSLKETLADARIISPADFLETLDLDVY